MHEYVPVPITWATRGYSDKPYHLVTLQNQSQEFINIEDHFDDYEIISIERVQNKFQYGRYLIYKLQKSSAPEKIFFMPLRNDTQLTMALRYNCDYRRLGYDKDMFYPTPAGAVAWSESYNKLIIVEGLSGYFNHDSGRYVKYVVTYERNN